MSKDASTEILTVLGRLALAFGSTFYRLFATVKVWNLVAPTLHAQALTSMWQAYALSCIVAVSAYRYVPEYTKEDRKIGPILQPYAQISIVWFATWLIFR